MELLKLGINFPKRGPNGDQKKGHLKPAAEQPRNITEDGCYIKSNQKPGTIRRSTKRKNMDTTQLPIREVCFRGVLSAAQVSLASAAACDFERVDGAALSAEAFIFGGVE